MGELVVSRSPGDVLVSIGLGSCIGLAVVDRARSLAGLAHVMLPQSNGGPDPASVGKFADLAVPALLERMRGLGSTPGRLEAVLVGGARMFSFNSSALDIGARNEKATLEHLRKAGVKVVATETSGSVGRTIRVHVGESRVSFKATGGPETVLLGNA